MSTFADALRELADFIDARPDLPLPRWESVSPSLQGTDDEDRAEVDRIANILGAAPRVTAGGHYEVRRLFGGDHLGQYGIAYEATAIPAALMEEWTAERSYAGAVQP